MKKYIVTLCVLFFSACTSMVRDRASLNIECRRANISDVPALLECIERASHTPDAENLVIFPIKFREEKLKTSVVRGQIFVSYDAGVLIGFKKMYLLTGDERETVLREEIRCTDQPSICGDAPHVIDDAANYIYTGADYTVPKYRGNGVNNALYEYALSQQNISFDQKIIVVFGVTQENSQHDRHKCITRSIKKFLTQLRGQAPRLCLHQYPAHKPTFAADAQECIPMSDGSQLNDFGCVLEEEL